MKRGWGALVLGLALAAACSRENNIDAGSGEDARCQEGADKYCACAQFLLGEPCSEGLAPFIQDYCVRRVVTERDDGSKTDWRTSLYCVDAQVDTASRTVCGDAVGECFVSSDSVVTDETQTGTATTGDTGGSGGETVSMPSGGTGPVGGGTSAGGATVDPGVGGAATGGSGPGPAGGAATGGSGPGPAGGAATGGSDPGGGGSGGGGVGGAATGGSGPGGSGGSGGSAGIPATVPGSEVGSVVCAVNDVTCVGTTCCSDGAAPDCGAACSGDFQVACDGTHDCPAGEVCLMSLFADASGQTRCVPDCNSPAPPGTDLCTIDGPLCFKSTDGCPGGGLQTILCRGQSDCPSGSTCVEATLPALADSWRTCVPD